MNCRPYSTPPPGRTSWWRKLATFGAALALFGGTASAQVAAYGFASSSGTYTTIDGDPNTVTVNTGTDDTSYGLFNIGFNFTYNGVVYTQFGVNGNGFIAMGAVPTNTYNFGSGTSNNCIGAFNRDLYGLAGNGAKMMYLTSGVAGSRVMTMEWKNWGHWSSGLAEINFQIQLFEGSNNIQTVYAPGTITTSVVAEVGLRGASAADFNKRTTATDWSATTAGGTAGVTCAYNAGVFPVSGTTFTWTPPAVCTGTPTAGSIPATITACGNTPQTINITGYTTGATGITFAWEESDDNGGSDPWGPVVGGSGAATASYTTAAYAGTRYYRAVVTCTGSGLSANTNSCAVNQNAACQFTVARNTNIVYSSIVGNGGLNYTGWSSGSLDDAATGTVSLAGTSFTYKGVTPTGFKASTNGWMTFNTALTPTAFSNVLGAAGTGTAILAPFWDDLFCQASQNNCMYYKIDGTLGSGTAKIIAEWANMEKFSNPGPNLFWQVILDENGNTITYRYGTMEGYAGNQNTLWSYSLGMNAWAFGTPASYTDVMALRDENTTNFDFTPATLASSGLNAQIRLPDCNSEYVFTPAVTYPGPGAAPSGAPSNDEIAGAIGVPVNAAPCTSYCGTYYSTSFATGTVGIPTCSALTPGTADEDVWFSFTANTANTTIRIIPGPNMDAVVQLLDATGTTDLYCVNAAGIGLTETISATTLLPGTPYLIRVYDAGVGLPASGRNDFSLCVNDTPLPPANDDCAGATVLTPAIGCVPVAGNSLVATASTYVLGACAGVADDDVWYQFVAPGTGATIRVQDIGTFNAAFDVYSSTTNDCTTGANIACVNSFGTGALEQVTLTTLTPGATYFIRVFHSLSGAANGQFTICVDAGAQCPVQSTPADGATSITLPVSLTWTAGLFASGYDVYFDTNNPPTTLVSSNQPGLSYNVNGPLANGTYYWTIQARNGLGATTTCSTRSVIVDVPPCIQPSGITAAPTSATTATVNWLCSTCTGTYIVEYGAPGFTPGTGATAGTGTVVTSASLSAALSGLTANTAYQVYVRQECNPGVEYSLNAGPVALQTAEAICGADWFDNGGSSAAYNPSSNVVRTFCGANIGETVITTFNSFDTETGWDPLFIYNGPSTTSPLVASANGAPFGGSPYGVGGAGGWWGTQIAGQTFTSSHPSGCLTFAFTSDGSVQNAGWSATNICAAPSACTVPAGVTATGVTSATATISWTCVGCTGTGPYVLEYGISGFTPGTGSTAGVGGTVITPATSPALITGLVAGATYKAYVRQDCDGTNTTFSNNSYAPATFTTGPGCGSNFYDLGGAGGAYPALVNGAAGQTVICPTNPADKVIVSFSSFQVEGSFDPLYVFDGNSTAAPMIASANGAPFTTPNYGAGGWWGTVAPTNTGIAGVVISTNPSGCLTFAHISDSFVQQAGWSATVSCASPQYTCGTAGTIACGEQKAGFTFGGTNTLPVGGCDFNGGASTSGVSWWLYSALATEDVSLSTCGLTTMNTRISVYKPVPDCTNLQCVGANDDGPGCPNGTSTMRFRADAGQAYYIAVSGNAANDGIFQLQLFCQPVCNLDLNDNDNCASATPITTQLQDGLQVLLDDDNSCSYVDGPTTCSGTAPAVGNWYSFNTVGNANYRVYVVDNSVSGAKTAQSMQYALYSGTCTDLLATGPVVCNSTGSDFNNLPPLTPNSPYKLFVYNNGSNSQVGSFGVWVDNAALYDADVVSVDYPTNTVCNLTLSPVVTLQNSGEATMTSAILEVSFDGGPPVGTPYLWTGSLATGASTSVTMPLISVPGGAHTITVSAKSPNGQTDQIAANDGASSPYDATGQTVVVTMKTGSIGSQCTWGVYDAFFFPVGVGGPYTGQNNQVITTNVCLATTFGSCFYFFVFDNAGDGLANATGWDLNDSQGRSILRDNGAFVGQSPSLAPLSPVYFAHEFCLPLGPSPIQAAECNIFNNYLNNKVYTTAVAGVVNYQFEFSDPNAGFYRRITLPRNWVKFGEMVSTPLVYGTTYYARARADQGAAGFSDDFYGAGCEMALAAVQPVCTELISTPGSTFSCGVTKTFGGSAKIWAQPVTYATQYRFKFTGLIDPDGPNPLPTDTIGVDGVNDPPVNTTRNIVRTSYVCPLNWFTYTLVSGQTYQVSVEVFVGGVWSGFCGATCPVTINNTPAQGGRIATETEGNSVSLWPNPVRDGRVNLVIRDLVDATQMITVDVYDTFGKRVMTKHYENAGQVFNTVLDLDADLAAGNYMVNITVNDELHVERLNVVR